MSVSNQKIVTIRRTIPPASNYFKVEQDLYWAADKRLDHSGMSVYMYMMSLVPDYWGEEINKENKRNKPFELSSSDISNTIGRDTRYVQRGINNLIAKGYLTQTSGNKYHFIDILPEDRCQTLKEHEKLLEYEEILREGQKVFNEKINKHLEEMAQDHVNQENENKKSKLPIQYSWESDKDYKKDLIKQLRKKRMN